VTSDEYGLSADAKEAVAFAILANQTILGRPGNMPGATGADRMAILGKICLP
jgi:anhydro-N-acetylmuramic acid kinase